jgi:para-nitrobenzyl esterase
MKKLILLSLLIFASKLQAQISVPTTEGRVVGHETQNSLSFKGIPYAAPPTGALRWAPTQAAAVRSSPFDAKDFGSVCVQVSTTFRRSSIIGDEDCLKMNIWKPKSQGDHLPVMVFVHGGANINGAGNDDLFKTTSNLYDGEYLSTLGVVVVTFNYRLGTLGFMAHLALSAVSGYAGSGNYGVMDQIEALKWVQQNIAAFGGDPKNVTVFGESAGAIDLLGMITSPLAKDLFSRAIIESGFLTETTLAVSEKLGKDVSKNLGCDQNSDVLACMRSKNGADVITAGNPIQSGKMVSSNLTIDNYVLKSGVLAAFRAGNYNHVPVIIGSNADEMTTLAPALTTLPTTAVDYEKAIQTYFGEQLGRAVLAKYPPYTYGIPAHTFEVLLGDAFIQCPTRQISRALASQQTPLFRYVFSHVSDNSIFAIFGAGHGLELPYVFHSAVFFASSREEILSQEITQYWKTFATTGTPTGAVAWPQFQNDQYINLDVVTHADQNFRGDQCDFWDQMTPGAPSALRW